VLVREVARELEGDAGSAREAQGEAREPLEARELEVPGVVAVEVASERSPALVTPR
jgi:hypothetical protein